MFVEVNELEISFNLEKVGKMYKLTIWTDGGFIEVNMSDEELEKLKSVLK